ncbi:MAG: LamG-like jellyroll fold domain-containing protein [Waterburya sp.]
MFKLILHHNYQGEKIIDLSGNGNHGHHSPLRLVEGRSLVTKAFYFNGIDDRIVVFPSESLINLYAIRATIWIWVEELGHRRNIMEGFLSFSFSIEADGSLRGSIYDGSIWKPIWKSDPNAIPLQEWVHIKYIYDGIDTSVLYVNDKLVASKYGYFGKVRRIQWPFGLNIGAWPDADKFIFKGVRLMK